MAGLQYAFRAMGVPSSLATLWLVDDAAMVDLVEVFYRKLRARQPKDVALQQAQLHYLAKAPEGKTSPFFWAAPVLSGSTIALPLTGRYAGLPRSGWLLAGGILLISLALVLLFVRRFRKPHFTKVFHVKHFSLLLNMMVHCVGV